MSKSESKEKLREPNSDSGKLCNLLTINDSGADSGAHLGPITTKTTLTSHPPNESTWLRYQLSIILSSLGLSAFLLAHTFHKMEHQATQEEISGTIKTILGPDSERGHKGDFSDSESEGAESKMNPWFNMNILSDETETEEEEQGAREDQEKDVEGKRLSIEFEGEPNLKRLAIMYNRTLILKEAFLLKEQTLITAIESKDFSEVEKIVDELNETLNDLNLGNLRLIDAEHVVLNPDVWSEQTYAINKINSILWKNRSLFDFKALGEKGDSLRKSLRTIKKDMRAFTPKEGMDEGRFSDHESFDLALSDYFGPDYQTPSERLLHAVEQGLSKSAYDTNDFNAFIAFALQEFLIGQNCARIGTND